MAKDNADLYAMKLHDIERAWNDCYEILRVPGGWLYTHYTNNGPVAAFVPFNNEFQPAPPSDLAF